MKHVLILGAGFGGLELARRLSDSVADEVRVTLIDQNDSFTFGFSKLDILFGKAETSSLQLRYRDLVKPGVEFRRPARDNRPGLLRRRHPRRRARR